jgi:catechol 2,3-dioxygenase-like lactoylglutathione lyase family enzyme
MANMANPAKAKEFEFRGINHLALTCADMDRTIAFYQGVLGMPLVKTIDFPGGRGKHYFFDIGGGDCLAFFEFPKGPASVDQKTLNKMAATPGMMHHVAFNVSDAQIEAYRAKLVAKGIEVTEVVNHDDTERGVSPEINSSTFVRSIYFRDPDGIQLEFASWSRALTANDVKYTAPVAAVAKTA